MTTLSWDDLYEIGTCIAVRQNQVKESIKVLAQYDDIVEMLTKELSKLEELEGKVSRAKLESL